MKRLPASSPILWCALASLTAALSTAGHGQVTVTLAGAELGFDRDSFNIDVIRRTDGTVSGQVTIRDISSLPEVERRGTVTCMTRLGDSGIVAIGANVALPAPAELPGHLKYFMLFVRDHSNRVDSTLDEVLFGFAVVPDDLGANEVCQFLSDIESVNPGTISGPVIDDLVYIDRGDISVRTGNRPPHSRNPNPSTNL